MQGGEMDTHQTTEPGSSDRDVPNLSGPTCTHPYTQDLRRIGTTLVDIEKSKAAARVMTDAVERVQRKLCEQMERWLVELGGPAALGGPVTHVSSEGWFPRGERRGYFLDSGYRRLAGYLWVMDEDEMVLRVDLYPPERCREMYESGGWEMPK